MNYLKTLSEPWEAIKENYEKELQLDEETVKDIEAIEE